MMKKYLFVGIIFFLIANTIFSTNISNLPLNIKISEDGRKLQRKMQPVTGLYDVTQLKTIYLQFSQSNWWNLLLNNYSKKIDIPATLTYEGKTYENVGVRFRGQTSYMNTMSSQKKSFNISIDYLDTNQRLEGYKTLNLNNCFDDPSFMKEALYSILAGQFIPIARTNFVKLVINGENWGVYSNVQQLNRDFYKEWFLSNEGANWRAEYPDTVKIPGGGFGAGYCSLNYLGDNPLIYTRYYTLKSTQIDSPWTKLMTACKMLNTLPTNLLYDSLKYYIDVDHALWHIACENIFTDDDGYVNKGGMDYYVYYDVETNRIMPIEYDGNSTFITKNVSWSPFLKETDTKFPLINKLLANPQLRQRYIAHMRTILNTVFTENYANKIIDQYKALIENEVNLDTKKLYSITQFNNTINEIKNFIKNRRTNLFNVPALKEVPPIISEVNHLTNKGINKNPTNNEKVIIQAKVQSSSGINKVLLYYGTGLMGPYNYIEMYDDGQHNDELANDGIYANEIPPFPPGTYVRYYIEARANNSLLTCVFNPEGAENECYFYLVEANVVQNPQVVINEFMASNTKTITDPQGEYDDWIELFNKGTTDINLGGMYLSDKIDNPTKWKFPENTIIKAGNYLIIWADENGSAPIGLHANFKLSKSGEVILLVDKDENGNAIIDSLSFGPQDDDISFGRYPNGVGFFYKMYPTPGAENSTPLSIHEDLLTKDFNILTIYPVPASNIVTIELESSSNEPIELELYDILGKKLNSLKVEPSFTGQNNIKFNLLSTDHSQIESGTYFLKITQGQTIISKPIVIIKE